MMLKKRAWGVPAPTKSIDHRRAIAEAGSRVISLKMMCVRAESVLLWGEVAASVLQKIAVRLGAILVVKLQMRKS